MEQLITKLAPMYVLEVLPDSPAERDGLLPGDYILKIDGEETNGMRFFKAISLLRGTPGTPVTITVLRGSDIAELDIERGTIPFSYVEQTVYAGDVGYLALRTFNDQTVGLVDKACKKLQAAKIKGLILDIRDNPGGNLQTSIDIIKKFVPREKLIVTVKRRDQDEEFRGAKRLFGDIPVVVIVNGQTASGGEILARALRENDLALIVGEKTHGKNSVETIIEINDELAIKYTIARWVSPDESNVNGGSLTPDIPVALDPDRWISLRYT